MSGGRGTFDPERLAERLAEESAARDQIILSTLDTVTKSIVGLQEDVRRGNLNDLTAERRFSDIEMQIMEMRESLNLHITKEAEAAARGGAAGAVEGLTDAKIEPAITRAMNKANTKPGKLTLAAFAMVVMVWVSTFVKEGPAVFRAVGAFFTGVTELDK